MTRLFAIDDALDTDAWYTPPWVFDGLGLTFDIDVASPSNPPTWIPAKHHYTVADDGLLQPWYGLVWCNPPYSAPTQWCRRWATHDDGLLLIRADLSTSGPFAAWSAAHACYVPAKRMQFVSGFGATSGAVNFSTLLLGRGRLAVNGMNRLAATCGGMTHTWGPA
jgi:hypothetical protein